MADTLHQNAPHLTAEAARQARWGFPVLMILLVSTFSAAALMLLAWAFWSGGMQRLEAHISADRAAAAPHGAVPDANAPPAGAAKTAPRPPQE